VFGERHPAHAGGILRQPSPDRRDISRERAEIGNAHSRAAQRLAQFGPCHAGFQNDVAILRVDLDDLLEAGRVDDDRVGTDRHMPARVGHAAAARVHRNACLR
jgi:hypothetical protein